MNIPTGICNGVFDSSLVELDKDLISLCEVFSAESPQLTALSNCRSPQEFVTVLSSIIDAERKDDQFVLRKCHKGELDFDQMMIREIDQLGWDKVVDVSEALDSLR